MGNLVYFVMVVLVTAMGVMCVTRTYNVATFTADYPNSLTYFSSLSQSVSYKILLTCNQPSSTFLFKLMKGSDPTSLTISAQSSDYGSNPNADILQTSTTSSGQFWIKVQGGSYNLECTMETWIIGNTAFTVNKKYFFDTDSQIHKISVAGACDIKLSYSGPPLGTIYVYDSTGVVTRSNPVVITTPQSFLSLPNNGDYYLAVSLATVPTSIQSYTLQVLTPCPNLCLDPTSTSSPPVCSYCGDGVRDEGEQCDNGDKPGCSSCSVAPYYACFGGVGRMSVCRETKFPVCGDGVLDAGEECDNGGKPGCEGCYVGRGYWCVGNRGGTSICGKSSVCGDGVVDQGEQCDNGNRPGCSFSCKTDDGYKCTAVIGYSSACSYCGNGILQLDEQCDNKNQIGCSTNCKTDPGFTCLGLLTTCYRNNPKCGNKITQIGQACDDGNTKSQDGCSSSCYVQQGYFCKGEPSLCLVSGRCGNGVYQPANYEECDNGNMEGCRGCVVEFGWTCGNGVGGYSVCLRRVVGIPHCGNNVLQTQLSEQCDDGNIANGDGCNSYCKIQQNWVCQALKKCYKISQECGNSQYQPSHQQQCDDGNIMSGDGCSSRCQIENGWECNVEGISGSGDGNGSGNKSKCRRVGFCGNGIVEGRETCDDGFPLRSGDGVVLAVRLSKGGLVVVLLVVRFLNVGDYLDLHYTPLQLQLLQFQSIISNPLIYKKYNPQPMVTYHTKHTNTARTPKPHHIYSSHT